VTDERRQPDDDGAVGGAEPSPFAPPVAPQATASAPYAPPGHAPDAPPSAPHVGAEPQGGGGQAFGGGQPFGAGPAWTPPPKPGLVPLRPMTLGTILGASFMVMRRNPKPTFGFALLLMGASLVVTLFVSGAVFFSTIQRSLSATDPDDVAAIEAGGAGGFLVSLVIPLALTLMAGALLQGVISLEVARGTVGERMRLRGLWRLVRGRAWALIGWTMMIAGTAAVALALAGVVLALLASLGPGGVAVAVLLGIVGGLGAVVLGAWLGIKLSLVPSAIVLERRTIRAAVVRSWTITTRSFWRVLGIQLLVATIYSVASQIVTTPITLVLFMLGALIGMGDEGTLITLIVVMYAVTLLLSILVGAVGAVVQSATAALLFIDLRMRREGLDLELIRFVEARQRGDGSVADPYLPKTAA
jgi:hypothetical protein